MTQRQNLNLMDALPSSLWQIILFEELEGGQEIQFTKEPHLGWHSEGHFWHLG
jgi:hypothetical protein